MRRIFFAAAMIVPLLLCSLPAGIAAHSPRATTQQRAEQFGKVNFPTNCSQSAQSTMERGLALLHSFQYQEAEQAFTNAARLDPKCALAYWGKAMALFEPLWDFPNAATLAKGRLDVEQAQKLGIEDTRIRGYIDAATAFYQRANLKPVARVQAYSSAMEELYRAHPEDNEAGELYALSLISLAQMGVEDLANRKKAIAILNPIFSEYPDNPGAAHYLIHAADVRELAPEGLAAALAYARIAPHSAHALHMPSHIFRRLGMWQESIDSNLASAAAAADATKEHRGDAGYQFHALDFLGYAYLQCGQEAKARRLITEAKSVPEGSESDVIDAQNRFAARNAMELHLWKEAAALEIPKERLVLQDYTYWTRAIGAARSGDVQAARAGVQKLMEIAQLVKVAEIRQKQNGGMAPSGMSIDPSEAAGWLAYAEGKSDEAVTILRSAAEREDARDDEPFATPAREMLADLLLELHRPSEALAAYQEVLKNYPNRFDALYGAARAADSSGDAGAAADFYAKLISNCPPNADRTELQAARKYVAAHHNGAQMGGIPATFAVELRSMENPAEKRLP
jgi:tetratricopeptide (TPR) repeat protein